MSQEAQVTQPEQILVDRALFLQLQAEVEAKDRAYRDFVQWRENIIVSLRELAAKVSALNIPEKDILMDLIRKCGCVQTITRAE